MVVTLNDEAQQYVWVRVEEALSLPVEPYTARAIAKYLSNRRNEQTVKGI
jgi:hypothetical protein